jgi:membrane protease YdiL (CAAX protease family)
MFRGILWAFLDKSATLFFKNRNKNLDMFKKDIVIIIIISLAFLFVHVGREVELLFTKFLLDSFVFSIIYYKSKNLSVPIIAHSISNFFVLFRSYVL